MFWNIVKKNRSVDRNKFINNNNNLWKKSDSKNKILVALPTTYPVSIVELLPIVKYLEGKYAVKPIFLLAGKNNSLNNLDVFESYGIDKYIFINEINFVNIILSLFHTVMSLLKIKTGEQLLSLEHKGITIGTIIYDTILRTCNDVTINSMKLKYWKAFVKAFYSNYRFLDILKRNDIKMVFLAQEITYVPYGILLKRVEKSKVEGYMQTITRGVYGKILNEKNKNIFRLNKEYAEKMYLNKNTIIEKARRYLDYRISGKSELLIEFAYKADRIYSRQDLAEIFGVSIDKKNIIIAAHCFSDACHYSYDNIYKDYYEWLIETILIISKNNEVNIFLKEHPASSLYEEQKKVEEILLRMELRNVNFLPNDFNTRSVIESMDCVVTNCGTMALEMMCFGIPGITTSKGYYSEFGLDINFSDKEAYKEKLLDIKNVRKITNEKMEKAMIVLYLCYKDFLEIDIVPKNFFGEKHEYWEVFDRQWEVMNENISLGGKINWLDENYIVDFHESYFEVRKK